MPSFSVPDNHSVEFPERTPAMVDPREAILAWLERQAHFDQAEKGARLFPRDPNLQGAATLGHAGDRRELLGSAGNGSTSSSSCFSDTTVPVLSAPGALPGQLPTWRVSDGKTATQPLRRQQRRTQTYNAVASPGSGQVPSGISPLCELPPGPPLSGLAQGSPLSPTQGSAIHTSTPSTCPHGREPARLESGTSSAFAGYSETSGAQDPAVISATQTSQHRAVLHHPDQGWQRPFFQPEIYQDLGSSHPLGTMMLAEYKSWLHQAIFALLQQPPRSNFQPLSTQGPFPVLDHLNINPWLNFQPSDLNLPWTNLQSFCSPSHQSFSGCRTYSPEPYPNIKLISSSQTRQPTLQALK